MHSKSSVKTNVCGLLAALLLGVAGMSHGAPEEEEEHKDWKEGSFAFPAVPQRASYQPFYVSAATENRFYVDTLSLTVGVDGVVRYVLLVETPGGAENVTFEGIRCESREKRIYASGRRDMTWSPSRQKGWERIREAVNNRHHAALFLEYFCPGGVIVRHAEEAVAALRAGGHPEVRR